MTEFSIKEKQLESVLRMLNLNASKESKDLVEEPWKVLIYDDFCRDILSTLIKKGDLMKMGITVHMSLTSDRQGIPDVPAIYFISPEPRNMRFLIQDIKKSLYEKYYLNFSSWVPRPLLEDLASAVFEADAKSQIAKITDQYMHFICLEKDLFTLEMPASYVAFNDPTLTDTKAEENIDFVVDSLFSVCVTMGVVPIIRSPKNGAAEAIAQKLDQKIHDHLNTLGNLFSDSLVSFQRPVLLLLDRNVDVETLLVHGWSYQTLVHDLLHSHLNRCQVEVTEENEADPKSPKVEKKFFDLDSMNDPFWAANASTPFPKIAGEVQNYINGYRESLEEFKKLSGGQDVDHIDESQMLGKTKDLGSFVSSIPKLREEKRIIDLHTNLATALISQIQERKIDEFVQAEDNLLQRNLDKKELMEILSDPKKGKEEDKLRLFLLFYLSTEKISKEDLFQLEAILEKGGVNLAPLQFLKQIRAFSQAFSSLPLSSPSPGVRSALS